MAKGIYIIDAGHFGIEKIFVPYMRDYVKRELPELSVYVNDAKEPFFYV